MPKRKRSYKSTTSTRKMAKKALKIARQVKASTETKYYDLLTQETDVDDTGDMYTLCNIPQGTTDVTRIGDKALMTSVRLRYFVRRGGSESVGIRMIIFIDKKETISTVSDLLAVTGSNASIISDYLQDKRQEYVILFDRVINVSPDFREKVIGFKRLKINKQLGFIAGGSTPILNNLKVIFISDADPTDQNKPWIMLRTRLFYQDS